LHFTPLSGRDKLNLFSKFFDRHESGGVALQSRASGNGGDSHAGQQLHVGCVMMIERMGRRG
jgi:hypothetical protein